jgi:hypothetical protein
MAPWRPDMECMGVLGVLLGNSPNWARGYEDCEDAERDCKTVGDANDAPDTEEYAESFPVKGGLFSPFGTLGAILFVSGVPFVSLSDCEGCSERCP